MSLPCSRLEWRISGTLYHSTELHTAALYRTIFSTCAVQLVIKNVTAPNMQLFTTCHSVDTTTARGRTSRFFVADIVEVMDLLQNATLVDKGGRRRTATEALRVWLSFFVNFLFIRLNETGLQSCCLLLFCALVSSLSPVYSSSRKVYLVTHSHRISRILSKIPTQSY